MRAKRSACLVTRPDEEGDCYERQFRRWYYDRAWSSIHRMLNVINLYPDTNHAKRMALAEYRRLNARRDKEFMEKRRARHGVVQLPHHESVDEIPDEYRAQWQGDVTFNGTLIKGAQRGNQTKVKLEYLDRYGASSDSDICESDHKATEESLNSTKAEVFWGYKTTLVAGVIRGPASTAYPTSSWAPVSISQAIAPRSVH